MGHADDAVTGAQAKTSTRAMETGRRECRPRDDESQCADTDVHRTFSNLSVFNAYRRCKAPALPVHVVLSIHFFGGNI